MVCDSFVVCMIDLEDLKKGSAWVMYRGVEAQSPGGSRE